MDKHDILEFMAWSAAMVFIMGILAGSALFILWAIDNILNIVLKGG